MSFCLECSPHTYEDAWQIIGYGVSRFQQMQESPSEALHQTFSQLASAKRRLATFHCLSKGAFVAKQWHKFRQCNLVEAVLNLVSSNDFDSAQTIWWRHVKNNQDLCRNALAVLNAIPEEAPSASYFEWLKSDLIPGCLAVGDRFVSIYFMLN